MPVNDKEFQENLQIQNTVLEDKINKDKIKVNINLCEGSLATKISDLQNKVRSSETVSIPRNVVRRRNQ